MILDVAMADTESNVDQRNVDLHNVDPPMIANIAELNNISHNHSFKSIYQTLDCVAGGGGGSNGPCYSDIVQCLPPCEATTKMACSFDLDNDYNVPGIEIDAHFSCSTGCEINDSDLEQNEFVVGDRQLSTLQRK